MAPRRVRSPPPLIDERCLPRQIEPEAEQPLPAVVHPGDERFHPFLRFTRADDRTDRDTILARAATSGYESLRHISWPALAPIRLEERAHTLLGPHWIRLFSMAEPVCVELAVEFFSTIHLITPLTDYERDDALTFRLGGVERRLSLHRFAVLMGLYTEEEIDTPAFRDGLTDWPTGITGHGYWPQIGTEPYSHPVPKSTKLRDPLHRLLHRAITFSLSTSRSSSGSVTLSDLFYLYCITTGTPCQLAERLARYMFSIRHGRATQAIYGGGYVYRLAKAMDILPPAEFRDLTITAQPSLIDLDMMTRMRMVRKDGLRYDLLDGDQQVWREPHEGDAAPAADEGVREDAGAGSSGTQVQPDTEPTASLSPRRHGPPLQVYHRTYPGRARRDQDRIGRIEEMIRLECAHAEAYRQYQTRMLQMIAGGFTGPFPDPPEPPQRLRDWISGASSSGTHH